jgi:hypothetical protein
MASYRCSGCSHWRFSPLHLRACLPRRMWAHELEQWPDPKAVTAPSRVISKLGLSCGCVAVIDWNNPKGPEYASRCKMHARHEKVTANV